VLAEGSRGSLAKQVIAKFNLRDGIDPPAFGLGFKELWQLPEGRVQPGRIEHAFGWPLDPKTYGGSFLYHLDQNRVYVGYVVGLSYEDPRLKPFEAFQQFKNHPRTKALLQGGEILAAGARTIAAGGYQSLPKLEMPGAMLIGDDAGKLNVFKIKGIHQAIRSGTLAAEHLAEVGTSVGFDKRWRASEGHKELHSVRNFKPGFKWGLYLAFINAGIEAVLRGKTPWTLRNKADWSALKKLDEYESPDREWVDRSLPPRDRLASVFFAGNVHDEAQPAHLKVHDTSICVDRCTKEYGNPCENFCPAGVYEMVADGNGGRRLQINAANCVHCKACDIKDPYEIITWTTPEGGSGPNYQNL
jgi:electron-transferring-flavoprotein dehydrogenase